MGTCKEASCSGSFEHFKFEVTVDAIFPPEAKGEFDTQMGKIIEKMFTHENQRPSHRPPSRQSSPSPVR